ncbi:MAG: hypothetical protein OXT67_04485 [Zetaproteobacteria bacterium]|nr:hypothetical protein [Zetaproteobacteria bacterium]
MNISVLRAAQKSFLEQYPGGFAHEELQAIGKKHKMDEMVAMTRAACQKAKFAQPEQLMQQVVKIISKSSMISVFDKPKMKDAVAAMSRVDKEALVGYLYEWLHGKEKVGFEGWVQEWRRHKMGRWPVVTAIPAYYRPQKEIFVKPNTTKLIIEQLELDVCYHSTPTWDFYRRYRKLILELKAQAPKIQAPNNPAFCGFLMMAL